MSIKTNNPTHPTHSNEALPLSDSEAPASQTRKQYLHQVLNLNHDPFLWQSAEKEIAEHRADDPYFFAYYVEPTYKPIPLGTQASSNTLQDALLQPEHSIIYGRRGSGKTTLAYHLAAVCRATPQQTLVVSLTLGKDETSGLLSNTNNGWQKLATELATDLFIQVIEQYNTNQFESPEQLQTLTAYWQQQIPHFKRLVKQLIEKSEANSDADISPIWWNRLRRPVVRYTTLTANRRTFLESILTNMQSISHSELDGQAAFNQGLQFAQKLNFSKVYFALDVTGEETYPADSLVSLLTAVLTLPPTPIPLFFKLFVPTIWQNTIQPLFQTLSHTFFSAIIQWEQETLYQLVANRFESAGSQIRSLNEIAASDVPLLFQEEMHDIKLSPRYVLEIISQLIDSHARDDAKSYLLTEHDWHKMQRTRQRESKEMNIEPFNRRDYEFDLFVEHQPTINAINNFLLSAPKTLLIRGQRAIGKTWLLQHLHQNNLTLNESSCYLHLPLITTPDQFHETLQNVLEKFISHLQQQEIEVQGFDPIIQAEALAERTASDLCQHHKPNPFYLLVDGGDLITQEAWRYFERRLVEPFNRVPCIHFIIALRDNQRLWSILRFRSETLTLDTMMDGGLEQVDKLQLHLDAKACRERFPHQYPWHHPGINYSLAYRINENSDTPLDAAVINQILDDLEMLPQGELPEKAWQEQKNRRIKLLACLAKKEEWQIDDLFKLLNSNELDNDSPHTYSLTDAWAEADTLRQYSLVTNEGQIFKVADGWRELFQCFADELAPKCGAAIEEVANVA